MAAGKPIIAALNGEGREVVEASNCGWAVKAGDSEALSRLIVELAQTDRHALSEKGKNGKDYYDKFFTKEKSLTTLDNIVGLS